MDPNGQVYFDSEDAIPEADQRRYLESLREESDRLRKQFEEEKEGLDERLQEATDRLRING